jgi:hypothetical protein
VTYSPEPDTNWYTDRSRFLDGFKCPRYRYLRYHSITGYGLDAKQVSVPLTTGSYTHGPLAAILDACKKGIPSTAEIREIIRAGLIAYRDDLKDRGFLDVESNDIQRTMTEQATLIEGMLWGYVRAVLPTLLKEFEIVAIEKEYLLTLAKGIVFQGRPDFVARRRSDGVLGIHDFKTASSLGDDYIASFNHSVQMSLGTAAVEAQEGEKVTHFYIHGLLKGSRRPFQKDGVKAPYESQHSPFCYAKFTPAMPPLKKDPSWALTGYWADKQSLWSLPQDFWANKPTEMSNVEFWVTQVLPLAEVQEQYKLLGPYERPDHLIKQSLREIEYEERSWIDRLFELHTDPQGRGLQSTQEPGPSPRKFGDPSFQADLQRLFPRSWECWNFYGGPCPMKHICFEQPSWQEPLVSGRYQSRLPQHEQEFRQVVSRGIQLPVRKA